MIPIPDSSPPPPLNGHMGGVRLGVARFAGRSVVALRPSHVSASRPFGAAIADADFARAAKRCACSKCTTRIQPAR